jgi:hypothetical protein
LTCQVKRNFNRGRISRHTYIISRPERGGGGRAELQGPGGRGGLGASLIATALLIGDDIYTLVLCLAPCPHRTAILLSSASRHCLYRWSNCSQLCVAEPLISNLLRALYIPLMHGHNERKQTTKSDLTALASYICLLLRELHLANPDVLCFFGKQHRKPCISGGVPTLRTPIKRTDEILIQRSGLHSCIVHSAFCSGTRAY